ncbi:hypothetical protein MBANPS3_012213 [Mucor bainieri]
MNESRQSERRKKMSASAASPAPSRTIDVIVSLHENQHALLQLKFLAERLNWDNLVSFIQSSSTLESPVVLYYKLAFDAPIETLENQEHLNQLLSALDSPSSLRFYGDQEHVTFPVFVSTTAAFNRLGALVDQHKQILKSNHHIARWIGMLATMMATSDRSFEREFYLLDNFLMLKLQRHSDGKSDKKKNTPAETDGVLSAGEDEEFAESPEVIDLDTRLDDLDISGRPGFGGRFGCGGPGFGGRGRHSHPFFYDFLRARLDGAKKDKPDMDLKACQALFDQFFSDRRHHHHHHGRPHPPHGGPSSDSEGEPGFGKFGGGRHHRRHHHGRSHPYGPPRSFGGPHPFGGPFSFDVPSDSDEEPFGPRRGKHFGCRGGRGGFGPGFSSRGGAPPAFGREEELFGGPGFGGLGFGGPGFGGHHEFGKHGKHHRE